MRSIIAFLLGLLFIENSCSSKRDSQIKITDTTEVETQAYHTASFASSELDVKKFVALTDSLLTLIQRKPISLTYKVDTISPSKIGGKFPEMLISRDHAVIKKYLFDPGKGQRHLRLWVIDASYMTSRATDSAFAALHHHSGEVGGDDVSPGLTYSNDYVIRTDRNIYWLNTGCSYAFFNHQKVAKLIVKSLQNQHLKDSILCKCGQAQCEL